MKRLVKNIGLGRVLALSPLPAFASAALVLRVHARPGETINLGSSGFGSGTISYAWPGGTRDAASDEIINPPARDGSRLVHEGETPSRKRKA